MALEYKILPSLSVEGRCSSYEYTGNVPFSYSYKSDNPTEHRTLPPQPLWKHPTTMTEQVTTKATQHHETFTLSRYENCNGVGSTTSVQTFHQYALTWPNDVDPYFTSHKTNWEAKAREKIADLSVNLGSNVAEYRSTVDSFKEVAGALYKAYKDLRRGRMTHGVVMDVPASILVANYGIAPLMGDLFGTALALQKRGLTDDLIIRKVVTSSDTVTSKSNGMLEVATKSQRAILYVQLDPNFKDIHLGNPIEWAWELIPFSFVVDSVIPIGNWLQSLDALKGIKSVTGTVTTKRTLQGKRIEPINSGYTIDTAGTWDFSSLSRAVQVGIDHAPFPSWEPSKSWRTVVNHLALLAVLQS